MLQAGLLYCDVISRQEGSFPEAFGSGPAFSATKVHIGANSAVQIGKDMFVGVSHWFRCMLQSTCVVARLQNYCLVAT